MGFTALLYDSRLVKRYLWVSSGSDMVSVSLGAEEGQCHRKGLVLEFARVASILALGDSVCKVGRAKVCHLEWQYCECLAFFSSPISVPDSTLAFLSLNILLIGVTCTSVSPVSQWLATFRDAHFMVATAHCKSSRK